MVVAMVVRGTQSANQEVKRGLRRIDLYEKIRSLMILRVVVITTFMIGALFLFNWESNEPVLSYLIALNVFLYVLTIIYSLVLNRIGNLHVFAYIQILGDIAFETGLIYISGSIFSPLSFLYILSIFTTSILLSPHAVYLIASISCIAYGTISALSYNMVIPELETFAYSRLSYSLAEVLYKLFVNFFAFYMVAYLSNYLIINLQRADEELDNKEEYLNRLQKLNDNILQSIDSGLMTIDMNGVVESFNAAAERITGLKVVGVLGKQADDFFPVSELLQQNLLKSRAGNINRFERPFTTESGKQLTLGFSRSILYDEHGRGMGYIIIFQDLTEIKRLENSTRRAEKMAIIGELAARIAHEIRNPLTSMKGSIELIAQEETISSSNRRLMSIVTRESERLNKLVTDFLQYAQPKKPAHRTFSLKALLEETIVLLENHPSFVEDRIIIHADISDQDMPVKGDLFQIKQVILNLCLNAAEAMPEGGTLTIESRIIAPGDPVNTLHDSAHDNENKQDSMICIAIRDTGSGIATQYRDQIFSPFFTTKEGGTGLGLSIAYRIVEDHNGYIDYQTEEGQGTCFMVFFHVAQEHQQVVTSRERDEQ